MPTKTIGNAGQIGIVKDIAAQDLPDGAWSDGRNVRCLDGYIERIKGHQAVYGTTSVEPYYVLPYSSGSGRAWIYAGANKIYSVSGSTHTNITRQTAGVDVNYSATADNIWTGTVLGGVAILNNGVDNPQQWGGTGKAADLSNWTANTLCKSMRSFKAFLVAMNLTISAANKPHRVRWSHPADPGAVPTSWDITDATKDAGEVDLAATTDRLIDGLTMGEYFYLYKESSIYRMGFVGGNDIFSFSDPISKEAGALGLNCIAPFPGGHLVLGQGDIYVNNGTAPESVAAGRLRKWLNTNLDATYYGRSFLVANPVKNEILVCIPQVGSSIPNLAIVWNWKDNAWTIRDLPSIHHAATGIIDATATNSIDSRTASIDSYTDPIDYNEYTQAAQRLVMASNSTTLYLADSTRQFNGSNFTAYISREGMDFDDSEQIKLIKEIWPKIDGVSGDTVQITVGGADEPDGAVTWGTPLDFVIGTDVKVDPYESGRYIAIKISSAVSTTWRVPSMRIEFDYTGKF